MNHIELPPDQPQFTLRRRILSLKGLCIGLIAGLTAVVFRLSLEYAEKLRDTFITFSQSHEFFYWLLPPVTFGLSIAMVVFVTLKFAPDAGGSGIPHLKGYLGGLFAFRGWRILIVKFVGGVIGIGSGLALGREGPTVQMGAAVAKILGDYLAPNRTERKILISAGAGAGLAAAFNAPLAGVFFVMEELHSNLNRNVLVTAFVACVTADIVCRLSMGHLPVFHIQILNYPEVSMIPFFMLLGIFLGFLGLLFNKSLLGGSVYVHRFTLFKKILLAFGLGIVFGLVGMFLPESLGTGMNLVENVLNNTFVSRQLLMYFILRFIFTMISYSTGAPGGIFAPLLLLGALIGSFFGHVVFGIYPDADFDFTVWGVLGMAGYFSAIVRAPVTGTILILEMTGAYDLLLPLMIVSIISYSIPEYFKDKPIYEALLHQASPVNQ
ncbi:MAG: H(+)/Cl(-) exchange transporter ClcA [Deltaproteobacteria bacterium]|nr:H(+)/Cl(-) exchange transporter ClcA [Deltaproteobacteria bacterium]